MNSRIATGAGSALIVIHAFMISTGVVLIIGMLSAAIAFAGGATVTIPMVATFRGFTELGSSPAMTMTGSWVAAAVLVAALTVVLSVLIIGVSRRREVRKSAS